MSKEAPGPAKRPAVRKKTKAAKPAAPAPPSNQIRFKCARCGAPLKVPTKLGGKYIDCPKCKNRTPVPESQAEADELGTNYGVIEMAYEVPENCPHCKTKIPKNSILCTGCGFDFKKGRKVEVQDFTTKEDDEMRGGPALQAALVDVVVLFVGIIGVALVTVFMSRGWIKSAVGGAILAPTMISLLCLPKRLVVYAEYRTIPIRNDDYRTEDDRAEREEARNPYGRSSPYIRLLASLMGGLVSAVLFSKMFFGGSS